MYTIGQFSKICKVTTKALRHYEKIGLITPARVGQDNQYRYYTREQVHLIKNISFMKELDIPLKTIKRMLASLDDQEQLKYMLEEHKKILLSQLDLYNSRLVKLSWWQKTLEAREMLENKNYDIRIREIQEMPVRSIRKQLTSFPADLPPLLRSLLKEIEEAGGVCAGPPVLLYYDEEFNPAKVDVEVAWPVPDGNLVTRVLPAVRAATCMHVGPYDGLNDAYEALFAWINQNGYRALTPMREVSYNDPQVTSPEQLVTEMIIPVEKA